MLEARGEGEVGFRVIHEIKSSLISDSVHVLFRLDFSLFFFFPEFIFLSFCFVFHLFLFSRLRIGALWKVLGEEAVVRLARE